MKSIKFVYRGSDAMGKLLASLLEEMSVEYTINSENGSTHVSTDVGALLRTLDEKVI
jgi:hypothetical protein